MSTQLVMLFGLALSILVLVLVTQLRPQRKVTGLSLSFCVSDILRGRVKENEVEVIISGICAPNQKDWDDVLNRYSETYWRRDPEKAKEIANRLRARGKIRQPRVDGDEYPNIVDGPWIVDGVQQHL